MPMHIVVKSPYCKMNYLYVDIYVFSIQFLSQISNCFGLLLSFCYVCVPCCRMLSGTPGR